ncbi:lysophospholipid acyltransferase family protein [Lutimonas zeaxanthinifaciens]|uniref:lysophospholipid acyltransferase family protein n=1 Tax=Lutimonas zeaxanthinifaciens TaxID=3060215 RepID=UPI00265D28BA|nr:lysophospholipid acyltransferase family protein [Lutimonas sp. YSD2104]WKK66301.1 lysophospholipid acyltransferase family protein [Lutimonas sp. YSD2104]
MSLVNSKEIAKVLKLDKFGWAGTIVGWTLLKTLRISKLNRIYERHKHKEDIEFLDGILRDFKIDFEIPEDDLARIPKEGAFITVSNHPLGGIDGILLLKLLVDRRPDYKIIANFLLHRIVPLQKYVMPVNPFEDHKDAKSSVAGIKNALLHLSNRFPLGIFPAGEVSTFKDGKLVVDKPWEEGAIKIIKKANVPVIPIYFHAKNSKLFYFLSSLSDTMRTAKLPSELLTQKNRVIKVRIGKPITVKEQNDFQTLDDFHLYLRKKTYMLANPFEKESSYINAKNFKIPKPAKAIIDPIDTSLIEKELKALDKNDSLLFTSKIYRIYLADSKDIPNTLNEIGRLREVTFREVGEGTNKALDLDQFDGFYKHLFLWDSSQKQLVGAYRMGLGQEIFKKRGIEGFYVNELFKIETELFDMMEATIEMGRAFIIKSYQQRPMPLFLLWKGIVHVTLRYPEHKYLMGGVSISNKFSNFSKSLMIEFMKSHYYDPFIAQYVHPKQAYKVKLNVADKDFVFDSAKADMNKFDKIIDELEPGDLRLPVLMKKYVKQNARLIAFNVDPKFNNAVDGLMYIRIADIPDTTVKPVMEEFQAELERKLNNEK